MPPPPGAPPPGCKHQCSPPPAFLEAPTVLLPRASAPRTGGWGVPKNCGQHQARRGLEPPTPWPHKTCAEGLLLVGIGILSILFNTALACTVAASELTNVVGHRTLNSGTAAAALLWPAQGVWLSSGYFDVLTGLSFDRSRLCLNQAGSPGGLLCKKGLPGPQTNPLGLQKFRLPILAVETPAQR
jgi:hypothetical protein